MRVARYLALVAAATAIALATVQQHVARTRLGYEARALERDIQRLSETKRAAVLESENAEAPEKLVARAKEFKIASDSELDALVGPVAPRPVAAARSPRKGR